jgi:tetratricopeptide (TPR) repeat protein
MRENDYFSGPIHFLLKPALLLSILIFLLYSNTLTADWHFDDYHNILHNENVRIESLNKDTLTKIFLPSSIANNSLYRPVSYFSFASNWYFNQTNVKGYHITNIAIHIFVCFFLFLSIFALFKTPNISGYSQNSVYFIAFLATVLWAIHPIQTQAVTYIVQRMASLASLFYIIAMFSYLKARLANSRQRMFVFLTLCGLSFIAAVGSKPNAMLMPLSLLLLEFIFFQDISKKKTQKNAVVIFIIFTLLIVLSGIFLFLSNSGNSLFDGYNKRPFSLLERILTQPRIIIFYISQIFYPLASRFSISHDIEYSTSLFSPWTTLPSILIILFLIGIALFKLKKNPLLCFAILFFFINHLVESTIIPLEMIFEHRNYLPSFFLFVPVAIGIKKAIEYYFKINNTMYYFLIISVTAGIIGLGLSTYIRNWDWRTEKSLWEDAAKKAPNSARPLNNLVWGYYAPTGQFDKAIELYKKAATLKSDSIYSKVFSYQNIATIYHSDLNNYEKAIKYSKKALEIAPDDKKSNFLLSSSLGKLKKYKKALSALSSTIKKYPDEDALYYLQAIIFMKTDNFKQALKTLRLCLRLSPNSWKYYREMGVCMTCLGNYERGYWYLKLARSFKGFEPGISIAIADNRLRVGEDKVAEHEINNLINKIGNKNIFPLLKNTFADPLGIPVANPKIAQISSRCLQDHSKQVENIAKDLTFLGETLQNEK